MRSWHWEQMEQMFVDKVLSRCNFSVAMHADMKNHTGNVQTLGRGAAHTDNFQEAKAQH